VSGRLLVGNGMDLAGKMIFKILCLGWHWDETFSRNLHFTKHMRYVCSSRMLRFSRQDLSYELENSQFCFLGFLTGLAGFKFARGTAGRQPGEPSGSGLGSLAFKSLYKNPSR